MAALTIELDGIQLATINLSDMEMVEITVRGAINASHKAWLEAGGGNYSKGGCGDLIWIVGQAMQVGQVLRVSLTAAGGAGDPGKALQELFPHDEQGIEAIPTVSEEVAGHFAVQVETSQGQRAEAASDELNTLYAFGVLWDSVCGKARVSLQTHCLEDEAELRDGTTHFKAWLTLEDSATFTLCN